MLQNRNKICALVQRAAPNLSFLGGSNQRSAIFEISVSKKFNKNKVVYKDVFLSFLLPLLRTFVFTLAMTWKKTFAELSQTLFI